MRVVERDAKRVVDGPGRDFVALDQRGKIGKPAASAEVQPLGRSLFELRLKIAPEPAASSSLCSIEFQHFVELTRAFLQHEHVAVAGGVTGRPSICALGGIG